MSPTTAADQRSVSLVHCGRKPGTRSRLSIQSVFIPRENIFFLREWLEYHVQIGVEHFYLYDNTGSTSPHGGHHSIEIDGKNKYELDIRGLSAHLTDEGVSIELDRIISNFPGRVTLVRWRPRGAKGRIIYGQRAAVRHCVESFGSETDWLCLTDLDEYLFSPSGEPISRFLDEMDASDATQIVLFQKKFLDRFLGCAPGEPPYVLEIEACIDGINTRRWGPKNIVRPDALRDLTNIHQLWVRHGSTYREKSGERLRFNHYNVNPSQLRWMKHFYRTDELPEVNGRDTGMRPYHELIREKCPPSEQIPFGVGG
jgi:hypothetical protein